MKARYDITYTTPDGKTYIDEAVYYYSKNTAHGKLFFYRRDMETNPVTVLVKSSRGMLKDEYRKKVRFNFGKTETLFGIGIGQTVIRPFVSDRDYHNWATLASRYGSVYGLSWSVNHEGENLLITRNR